MSFNIDDYFSALSKGNTFLSFKGNFDPDRIGKILDTVEDKMIKSNEPSRLRKRVYNVLVESLQNLYHHVDSIPEDFADKNTEKFGMLSIIRVDKGYRIFTGNFVRNEDVESLEEKIKRINQSTREEISELYKFILNHQRISSKGGGGLGLVDIARKTGNKLDYGFKKYDNKFSFFNLNILVKEEN